MGTPDHQCDACIEGFVRALENNELEDRIARSGYQRYGCCPTCVAEIRGADPKARASSLMCFNSCFPKRTLHPRVVAAIEARRPRPKEPTMSKQVFDVEYVIRVRVEADNPAQLPSTFEALTRKGDKHPDVNVLSVEYCSPRAYQPPPTCPSCDSLNIVKYLTAQKIDVGVPPNVIQVSAIFSAWKCQSCRFGWRDDEAEGIIEAAIRAHPEASKLAGV